MRTSRYLTGWIAPPYSVRNLRAMPNPASESIQSKEPTPFRPLRWRLFSFITSFSFCHSVSRMNQSPFALHSDLTGADNPPPFLSAH